MFLILSFSIVGRHTGGSLFSFCKRLKNARNKYTKWCHCYQACFWEFWGTKRSDTWCVIVHAQQDMWVNNTPKNGKTTGRALFVRLTLPAESSGWYNTTLALKSTATDAAVKPTVQSELNPNESHFTTVPHLPTAVRTFCFECFNDHCKATLHTTQNNVILSLTSSGKKGRLLQKSNLSKSVLKYHWSKWVTHANSSCVKV